jgi:hypothetical protein
LSKAATISKLEALLSRIRTRAAEPRSVRHAAPAPALTPTPIAVAAVPVAPVMAPAPPSAFAPATSRAFVPPAPPVSPPPPEVSEGVAESIPPEMLEGTTLPPPPLADAPGDADFDVDVDVAATTPQPAVARTTTESDSRERLSAAPAAQPEAVAVDVGRSVEPVEVLSDEEAMASVASDDDQIEEAPVSSRRPVAPPPEERLAELAFGAEEPQPARHTPPPKSGRLPAPPAVEFDADVTGVRAAPGRVADDEAVSARGEPSILSPQAVRAELASGASVRVADVIGEAQAFAPATFLALLDASLSL